jgi:hypothetical protein
MVMVPSITDLICVVISYFVVGDHLSISFQRHWENIMRITIIQI